MKRTIVEVEKMAAILKVLGDKTRLTMLGMMLESDCCVCEFVDVFQMSQPAISQHLRKLKEHGLVSEQKKSQWVFYSLYKESEYYDLIVDLLQHIPNQKDKIEELSRKGIRIKCE